MSKQIRIISTLAESVRYALEDGSKVVIHGLAGKPDTGLVVRSGITTAVTPEQLVMLKKNRVFQVHQDNGYVDVLGNVEKPHDETVEKLAENLSNDDVGKPHTPDTLAAGNLPVPVTAADAVSVENQKPAPKRGRPAAPAKK